MRLHIAGGCGEHGRNCFHITDENVDFLVDCGVMAGAKEQYPHLSPEEIPGIQTVFLTHSHADHTGALPWLYENGFHGEVVASEHTLAQLQFKPEKVVALEKIRNGSYRNMKIQWGKSGHCLGSVWYKLSVGEKAILFSGDYTECSPVYRVDRIRGQSADLAVIDCAYGDSPTTYEEDCDKLLSTTEKLLSKHDTIFFPVPKYGRGLDLLFVFLNGGLSAQYYGDEHFLTQLHNMRFSPGWYYMDGEAMYESVRPYCKGGGIVFVSDPQLRGVAYRTAVEIVERGGVGVMTGTVEEGSNSAEMIEEGKMVWCRYPVHLSLRQHDEVVRENQFKAAVAYHSEKIGCAASVVDFKRMNLENR